MTPQKIHERCLARVQDGTGQARTQNSVRCCYSSDGKGGGHKCVVGGFLDPENYDPDMEGASVFHLNTVQGKWRVTDVVAAGWSDIRPSWARALANALNKQGIPATNEIHRVLTAWQYRHDSRDNWEGTRYIGPTDFPRL